MEYRYWVGKGDRSFPEWIVSLFLYSTPAMLQSSCRYGLRPVFLGYRLVLMLLVSSLLLRTAILELSCH